MTGALGAVVIGIGNPYRRDDGVGPAVAEQLAAQRCPGIRVLTCAAEPTAVIDAWSGAGLVVLVDAAAGLSPGAVRTVRIADLDEQPALSSHDLGLRQTWELSRALGSAPEQVLIVTVGVADTGHGVGLSAPVSAALPGVLRAVLDVLESGQKAADQQA